MSLKIVSSVVTAALLSTSLMAAGINDDFTNDPVRVDHQNKTGDYLLVPSYAATESGWETNLRVVNTNTTYSVVAKVVVREAKNSIEVLDFAIYLSPGDVWEGTFKYDATAASATTEPVVMTSSDDSMVIGGVVATAANPITLPLNIKKNVANHSTRGYVEVFGLAKSNVEKAITQGAGGARTVKLGKSPISKLDIYDLYSFKSDATTTTYNNFISSDWEMVGNDDLTAQAVHKSENATYGPIAMTEIPVAFENFTGSGNVKNPSLNVAGLSTSLSTVSNRLSVRSGEIAATYNELVISTEAAITRDGNYVVHYDSAPTEMEWTFPTKHMRNHNGLGDTSVAVAVDDLFTLKDPYSGNSLNQSADNREDPLVLGNGSWTSDYYMAYSAVGRDMMENKDTTPGSEVSGYEGPDEEDSTCDYEMCRITVNDAMYAPNGWIIYDVYGTDDQNTIVQSLPYVTRLKSAVTVGGQNITNMVSPAGF